MSSDIVGIVWRDDGNGKGAFWDHYTLQNILNCETVIVPWPTGQQQNGANSHGLLKAFADNTYRIVSPVDPSIITNAKIPQLKSLCAERNLPTSGTKSDMAAILENHSKQLFNYGISDPINHRIYPRVETDLTRVTIIVIPGVEIKTDKIERRIFEESLLTQFSGLKPIIMLCGGMWRLQTLGANVAGVDLHAERQMVSLNVAREVIFNPGVHYIERDSNCATSQKIWGTGQMPLFEANSVHSDAIFSLGANLEDRLAIVCMSGEPVLLPSGQMRKNRVQASMNCPRIIEAVCSKTGPPIIAAQWHPEAYFSDSDPSPHKQLLRYALHTAAWNIPTWVPSAIDEPSINNGDLILPPPPPPPEDDVLFDALAALNIAVP